MKKAFFPKFLTLLMGLFIICIPSVINAQDYYGAPWGADRLGNTTIGEYEGRYVDYRFRAKNTGTTSELVVYFSHCRKIRSIYCFSSFFEHPLLL